ncbi:MAG: hypothetical protein L6N96_04415 [Candidatus Methylarchaceae archaeon HK02M2]|nr:hypothetical protein [Candidatus Methylarchaceae archaeon HK02M2]
MSKDHDKKIKQKINSNNSIVIDTDDFIKAIKNSSLEIASKEVDVVTSGTYSKRLAKKWRRPHLKIDFKEYNKIKPYIDIKSEDHGFYGPKSKLLRMVVRNFGRTPATYCEAKLTMIKDCMRLTPQVLLHWIKLDPTIYDSLDDIFGPITINAKESEELDVLRLRMNTDKIETVSDRIMYLEPERKYSLEVSIFSGIGNNPTKTFDIKWDGTYDGFDKCVQ